MLLAFCKLLLKQLVKAIANNKLYITYKLA